MNDLIEFEVFGREACQGSVAYHPLRNQQGQQVRRNGRPVLVPHHDSKTLKPWRRRVAANARIAMDGRPPLTGAVEMTVTIYRARPKAHYNNKGILKDSAPAYPTPRPDTLKQIRAIEDALTGIVYFDDSQIVDHHLFKRFAGNPVAVISVNRKD